MKKTSAAIIFLATFLLVQSAPIDPEDEVELISPVKTEIEQDEEGYVPIFVIKRTEGSPFFPFDTENEGFFPFNFFDEEPQNKESIPEIPLMPTFFEQEADNCGFICIIMKQFEDKLRSIEDQIKNIHKDIPETHNSTYTEKVLPDGSVVKINRTVISDTSEDGNSFFFHSTSVHNIEDEPEIEVEIVPEIEAEIVPEEQEVPLLDESINEVAEDNVGVDSGLA